MKYNRNSLRLKTLMSPLLPSAMQSNDKLQEGGWGETGGMLEGAALFGMG